MQTEHEASENVPAIAGRFSKTGSEFLLREYDSLKNEIRDLIEHSRKLEIYAVGAIAALFAWYLADPTRPKEALAIPMIVALLGALRSFATLTRIKAIAWYLRDVEMEFGVKGWETHHYRTNSNEQETTPSASTRLMSFRRRSAPFVRSAGVFWTVLLIACVVGILVLA